MRLWLNGRSAETTKAYTRDIGTFSTATGNKAVKELTLLDVTAFLQTYSPGKSASTVNRMISVIKSFLSFALRVGYVQYNVAAPVRLRKIDRRASSQTALTAEEMAEIRRACRTTQETLVIDLLFKLGLRASELCGIRKQDVTATAGGGRVAVLGKGGKTRFMGVAKPTLKAIQTHVKGLKIGPSDTLFYNASTRNPLNRVGLWCLIKAIVKRTSIKKKVSPHTFRHTMCSMAIQNGAPVALVSRTLGHSTLAVTSRYLHMNEDLTVGKYLAAGSAAAAAE